jgi:hypothetical protein
MSHPITLEQQAAYYAEKHRKAIADLPALIAERDAAEAAWCEKGGSVRMWLARDAVTAQYRFIDKMKREADTHALLLDLCKGVRR